MNQGVGSVLRREEIDVWLVSLRLVFQYAMILPPVGTFCVNRAFHAAPLDVLYGPDPDVSILVFGVFELFTFAPIVNDPSYGPYVATSFC